MWTAPLQIPKKYLLRIWNLGFGLCFSKDRKSLFLFNVTERNSDTEGISVISCDFPGNPVPVYPCLRRWSCIPKRNGQNRGSGLFSHSSTFGQSWQLIEQTSPADHTEITARVTGSEWGRQKVRGNVELRKEGMQQLPISVIRWSNSVDLVCKWLGNSQPNCEGRLMNSDKKRFTSLCTQILFGFCCHLTSASPPHPLFH